MATYNGEKYIREQIDSILCQIRANDELVISDDGSNDDTIEIIKEYEKKDSRVKLFHNTGEHKTIWNFENALQNSKGKYIFLADQDDIWCQNKIETYLRYFNDYDIIVSDAKLIDERGNLINDSFFSFRKPRKTILGNLLKFGYLGCCMAFKREVFERALPFPSNSCLCTHDNWLFLIGCCYFKYKILEEKLLLYRRHADNVSTGGLQNTTSFLFKIHYRLYLFFHLITHIQFNERSFYTE